MSVPPEQNHIQPTDTTVASPGPAIRAGWLRAILFYVGFAIFMVGAQIVALLVITPDQIMSGANPMESMTLWQLTIIQAIAVGCASLVMYLFSRFLDRRSMVSFGFSWKGTARMDFVAGLIWGVVIVTLVFLLLYALNMLTIVETKFPLGTLALGALMFILVAVQEEIVSRGYLLNNFMQSMNKYFALALVSVLFALGHATNPNVNLVGLANIVLAGLLLGIYYVHRQNLWFPIGLHLTWNFFQGFVLGSPVSGVPVDSVLTIQLHGNDLLTGGEFGFEASLITTVITALAILVLHLKYRPRAVASTAQELRFEKTPPA